MIVDGAPRSEGYVQRDGLRIHFQVFGDGPRAILLLPTWSIVHSDFWRHQVPHLAKDYTVVVFDGLGNGRSDRPLEPEAYNDRLFALDAIAVLDAAGVEQAVSVSNSAGACWNLVLAAEHSDRIPAAVSSAHPFRLARHSRIVLLRSRPSRTSCPTTSAGSSSTDTIGPRTGPTSSDSSSASVSRSRTPLPGSPISWAWVVRPRRQSSRRRSMHRVLDTTKRWPWLRPCASPPWSSMVMKMPSSMSGGVASWPASVVPSTSNWPAAAMSRRAVALSRPMGSSTASLRVTARRRCERDVKSEVGEEGRVGHTLAPPTWQPFQGSLKRSRRQGAYPK